MVRSAKISAIYVRSLRSRRSPLQICREQLERSLPRVFCFLGAVDVGPSVVEESVRASFVNLDLALLAEFFQRRYQTFDVRPLDPSVVLAVRVKNWTVEMLEFFVRRDFAIERRRGRYFLALARQQQRVTATHAEPRDSDAGRFLLLLPAQPFHRGLEIRDAVFLLQPAHQARGFVGIGRDLVALARVQVRRDREVALTRQPPRDVADVLVQPPPFLYDD